MGDDAKGLSEEEVSNMVAWAAMHTRCIATFTRLELIARSHAALAERLKELTFKYQKVEAENAELLYQQDRLRADLDRLTADNQRLQEVLKSIDDKIRAGKGLVLEDMQRISAALTEPPTRGAQP